MKFYNILSIYDALISGETVSRSDFCADRNISERTFYRYMREIVLFLQKNKHSVVIDVIEPNGIYYMKKCELP